MRHLLTLLALALLGASCASTWHPHRFVPAPLEVPFGVEGNDAAQATALLTILGIRRANKQAGNPTQVEVLLQIENHGQTPALLLLEELRLVTSDLVAFDTARVEPPTMEPVVQGAETVIAFSFPLPPGQELSDLDLRGLHLRWAVSFGEQTVVTGVTFEREQARTYYDPYYSTHYHYRRGHYRRAPPTPTPH